jgi:hypothetical protein
MSAALKQARHKKEFLRRDGEEILENEGGGFRAREEGGCDAQ